MVGWFGRRRSSRRSRRLNHMPQPGGSHMCLSTRWKLLRKGIMPKTLRMGLTGTVLCVLPLPPLDIALRSPLPRLTRFSIYPVSQGLWTPASRRSIRSSQSVTNVFWSNAFCNLQNVFFWTKEWSFCVCGRMWIGVSPQTASFSSFLVFVNNAACLDSR